MTIRYVPKRRSSSGMERRGTPAGPGIVIGSSIDHAPEPQTDTWWTRPEAQTREGFAKLRQDHEARMAASREARFVATKFLDGGTA